MVHLRGLAGLGVVNNPPYLGEWPQKIGMYMLNFGGIELIFVSLPERSGTHTCSLRKEPGSDAERSAPDLIGIPDMRQAQGSNVSDSIGIDGLNKLIDASYAVAQRLHASARPLRTTEEESV